MVSSFYNEVAAMPIITDQEMGSAMQLLSAQQSEEFDTVAALKELHIYVVKYREQ
ncbi:putative receptor, partial [Trypoxylus dichotomus]